MKSTISKQNVLATIAMVAMFAYITGSMSTVNAHTPNFMPYGEVGQEDEAYYWHDGVLYINAVPSQGNGLFIAETDIDQDYSIDAAIQRFHIDEDTTHFNVQPSMFSETELVYQLDDDLQFQLIGVV